MSDTELEKLMSDPNAGWWTEPLTLIFGKSVGSGALAGDVFSGITTGEEIPGTVSHRQIASILSSTREPQIYLAGPWLFYEEFRQAHGLTNLPRVKVPEIGVKAGSLLSIPLLVIHDSSVPVEISLKAKLPDGWKVTSGEGRLMVPAVGQAPLRIEVQTPELSTDALKSAKPQEVSVQLLVQGKPAGAVHLNVLLQANALPQ
jgi:hypothetical protein